MTVPVDCLERLDRQLQPINYKQLIDGLLLLCMGGGVYLFLRAPIYDILLPISTNVLSGAIQKAPIITYASNSLPSFFHTFSFCLLSCAFCTPKKSAYFRIVVLWMLIELLLEFSQIAGSIHHPNWVAEFEDIPFVSNVTNFFFNGYFCLGDVAAVVIGGVAAFIFLPSTLKRSSNHAYQS